MHIKTKNILTTLVVAGISAVAFPAKAATTFTAGDLLLGFRATGGTGAASSLIVNIGDSITIRDNDTSSASLIDIGAALTSTYGSGWDTRTDLFWGVVGVRSNSAFDSPVSGDPARTLYMGRVNGADTIGAKSSSNLTTATNTVHGTVANNVAGFQQAFDTYAGATLNGGLAAAIDTSVVNTWEDFTSGSSDFSVGTNIEGVIASEKVLDLYRILGDTTGASPTGTLRTGAWQGTVSLSSAGVVSFDPVAIPEPSRVLFLGCGLGGLLMRRRRAVRA